MIYVVNSTCVFSEIALFCYLSVFSVTYVIFFLMRWLNFLSHQLVKWFLKGVRNDLGEVISPHENVKQIDGQIILKFLTNIVMALFNCVGVINLMQCILMTWFLGLPTLPLLILYNLVLVIFFYFIPISMHVAGADVG